MNNRKTGSEKEQLACDFLKQNGVIIVEKNYRFHRNGEIDLIGHDGEYLVFFEVKYRKTANAGYAAQAVNFNKIRQICKVADYYRMTHSVSYNKPVRFDVVAIDKDNINWIKNAFDYAL